MTRKLSLSSTGGNNKRGGGGGAGRGGGEEQGVNEGQWHKESKSPSVWSVWEGEAAEHRDSGEFIYVQHGSDLGLLWPEVIHLTDHN